MDLVEKIKTITCTACAAILTIVASICIFKLSNRACKVMDNLNGAIEGKIDENGVPQDGLAGLIKKGNEVADDFKDAVKNLNGAIKGKIDENGVPQDGLAGLIEKGNEVADDFKVVFNGEPDGQGVPHGGLKDAVKNLNDAIEGRFDENGQLYGVLPTLKYVTGMVDSSKPAPDTIGGNVLEISKYGMQVIKKLDEVTNRVHEKGIIKGIRMTREDAEKDSKKSSGLRSIFH